MSAEIAVSTAPARAAPAGAWLAEYRATLALAWPLVLTNLTQNGLATADVILIGRLGPTALAAGALGTNLFFVMMIFGIGLTSATAPMLAAEFGRNRHAVREVRRTVRQGLWSVTAVVVPLWLLLWHGEAVLALLGQEPALAAVAGPYLRALMWALWPMLAGMVLRQYLAALERPRWTLVVGLAALVVNVALAWWLMFGGLGVPPLGLVGTGLATSVTSGLAFLALVAVVSLDRRMRRYRLFGRFWRADWPRFATVWRLGLPIALTLLFESGLFSAAAFAMGTFGATALAAHAITLQVAAMCFMVPLGIAQAATVRVGRASGAGDAGSVTRAGWAAFTLGTGFMALVALVQVSLPRAILAAFLDLDDPANAAVVPLAVTFLHFAALFAVADGAQATGLGMLRGLQDTRVPMLIAGLGYWGLGAGAGVLLAWPGGLAGSGLWLGLTLGLTVVALLLLRRWTRRERLGLLARGRAPVPSAA
jgi:multidrug resistance protein, MATE family